MTDVMAWPINPNPSCSKNRKINRKENKNEKKNKISQVHLLWSWQVRESGYKERLLIEEFKIVLLSSMFYTLF